MDSGCFLPAWTSLGLTAAALGGDVFAAACSQASFISCILSSTFM